MPIVTDPCTAMKARFKQLAISWQDHAEQLKNESSDPGAARAADVMESLAAELLDVLHDFS